MLKIYRRSLDWYDTKWWVISRPLFPRHTAFGFNNPEHRTPRIHPREMFTRGYDNFTLMLKLC